MGKDKNTGQFSNLINNRKDYIGSALSDEFGDTIILERKALFKRQKYDEYVLQYPGDEFVERFHSNKDTCHVSVCIRVISSNSIIFRSI